jgi:outer membrane immunogenic protein
MALLQCDKNATSAKQIAGGAQELCILRLLRLPCAIYSFILFQQAPAVLFEPAQWPRLTGWLTSQRDLEDPNMRRFLLASTTLIALAAGFSPAAMTSSWAADFAPPAVIPYNWTGCFVGAQVGGGAQSDSQTGMTGIGMLGGGHAGCNYQIYSFVVGIEGEGAWTNLRSRNDNIILTPGGMSSTSTERTKSIYDVAVRFGYTFFDRTLIYTKLGVAWSNQSYDIATSTPTTATANWSTPGVLIGEGFECEITPQWLARIEMDMFFFDSTNVTFATTGGPPPFIQTVNSRNVVVKLGLSYKLF